MVAGAQVPFGDGNGNGDGDGYGYGDGYGNGDGYGSGNGYGNGNGYGYGDGDGNGNGNGNGDGLVFVHHSTPMVAYWRETDRKHFGSTPAGSVGEVLEWPYLPTVCQSGLHACLDRKDTTQYSPGKLLRVACSGWVRFDGDKLACTRREVLEVLG